MMRFTLSRILLVKALLILSTAGADRQVFAETNSAPQQTSRPNILLCVSDDHSWRHFGAYGDLAVKSPAFDRVAREGVLFQRAYTACPSCTASRSAILTGQPIWRLEEGSVFGCTLPRKFDVFPVLLQAGGYHVGWTGKGWGPGNLEPGGWNGEYPQGIPYNKLHVDKTEIGLRVSNFDYAANFASFLKDKPRDTPFAFWCGFTEPHRGYAAGSGLRAGKKLADAGLPGHLPDQLEVRSDILDYSLEIEYLDAHLGRMLRSLEQAGELDNTLVIVTSDQGMPFPRSKPTLYDIGTHVPLAIRWPARVPGGRIADDFVSLTDVAPTILEAVGVEIPLAMTGRSLIRLLTSEQSGQIDPSRTWIVTALERHGPYRRGDVGYPCRALHTEQYLYIWNINPERWPAGDGEFNSYIPARNPYPEIDPGPTKDYLIQRRDDPAFARYVELAFGKHPAEELYDAVRDPDQLNNLADKPEFEQIKRQLRDQLEEYLRQTLDPRVRGENPFDQYRWDRRNSFQSTFGVPARPAAPIK